MNSTETISQIVAAHFAAQRAADDDLLRRIEAMLTRPEAASAPSQSPALLAEHEAAGQRSPGCEMGPVNGHG